MRQLRPLGNGSFYGEVPLLIEDADDELLAIMGADADSTEKVQKDRADYAAAAQRYLEWQRERRPAQVEREKAYQREYAARYQAQLQAEQADYERKRAELLRAQRDEWIGLFKEAAGECLRNPKYRVLLPDLERDMETIEDHPKDEPLPWKLDTGIFWKAFAQRKAEIDGGTDDGSTGRGRGREAAPR